MKFSSAALFFAASIVCSYSTAMAVGDPPVCPLPELIKPCTCFHDYDWFESGEPTILCSNFTDSFDIIEVLGQNKGWLPYNVLIIDSVMAYIPTVVVEKGNVALLNITSTTLVSLFDVPPTKSSKFILQLNNVKVLRGFEWSSISHLNLTNFEVWNMDIKHFGKDFKDYFPTGIEYVKFVNTRTIDITHQAFSRLGNVTRFEMEKGNLKKINRDMFPKSWEVQVFVMKYQKISVLPIDIFDDMPDLIYVDFDFNLIKILPNAAYAEGMITSFQNNPINCDCNIKWIASSQTHSWYFHGACATPESLTGKLLSDLSATDFSYCQ